MKYNELIQLIKDAAEDNGLNYSARPHAKSRGVFVTLTPKQGKGLVRHKSISPYDNLDYPRTVDNLLTSLFGPKKSWNARIKAVTSGRPVPDSKENGNEKDRTNITVENQMTRPPEPPPITELPSIPIKKLSPFAAAAQRWERDYPLVLPPSVAEVTSTASADQMSVVIPEEGLVSSSPAPTSLPTSEVEAGNERLQTPQLDDTSSPTTAAPIPPKEDLALGQKAQIINIDAAPAIEPPSVVAPDDTRYGFRRCLLESGLIAPDDSISVISKKITQLVNSHPAVTAKGNDFVLPESKVAFFFRHPRKAFMGTATTINITAYRIWQAVDDYNRENSLSRHGFKGFWDEQQKPAEDQLHALGREVYEKRVLPLLDRENNRHIQGMEQLTEILGLGDTAFSTFITRLHNAYVRRDGKAPEPATQEGLIASMDFVPSETLGDLANLFGCTTEEIAPRAKWAEALATIPLDEWKDIKFIPAPIFDENALSPESMRIMADLRELGIEDLHEIRNDLNKRLEQADPSLPIADNGILISTIRRAVVTRKPYGRYDAGFENIAYHRIAEAINERREKLSLPRKTTGEIFYSERRPTISLLQQYKNEAQDNLISVLEWPQNRHWLSAQRLATHLKISPDAMNAIFDNIHLCYTQMASQQPVANPELQKLANALHCEPTIIVSHRLWSQAVTIKGSSADSEGPIFPELRNADTGDFPEDFLRAALASRAARELPPLRARILAALNERVKHLSAEATVEAPTAAGNPTTDASRFSTQDASPITDKFMLAVVEVVASFRALNNPATAIQFVLMDKAEGINLTGQKERLENIFPTLGLPTVEIAQIVLDATKAQISTLATKTSNVHVSPEQAADILRLYRNVANITGAIFLDQWLDLGRDDTLDELIGEPSGLAAPAVKGVRDNLLKSMARILASNPETALHHN